MKLRVKQPMSSEQKPLYKSTSFVKIIVIALCESATSSGQRAFFSTSAISIEHVSLQKSFL